MPDLVTLRPGLTLDRPAAESWARMEAAAGRRLDVNRSTVDRDSQMRLYLDYEEGRSNVLALHPDRSWHCLPRARAVDTDDDAWIRNHPEHGWRFVVPSEKWHAQYYPEHDRRPALAGGQETDDMTPDERTALFQIRDYLGAAGGLGTATPDTVGYRVRDIQLALTNAIPVLVGAANRPSTDPAAIAEAVAAAIPDDLAQDVIDALAQRLQQA